MSKVSFPSSASWKETISVSDELLRYIPNYPEAHFERGIALMQLGKHEEAIGSLDVAIKYNHLAKHSYMVLNHLYYYIGQCLDELGRLEEVLESFDLAIKHGLGHRHIHSERYEVLTALGRKLD